MEYKNAHAWRVDFERKQQLILQKMREIVEEESKVLMDDVNAEYGAYEKEKITEVFQNAVTKFYNAYTPTLYEREGDTAQDCEPEPAEKDCDCSVPEPCADTVIASDRI